MVNRLRNVEARYWWALILALVLVALALIVGANVQRSSAEAQPTNYRTSQVMRGDIEEVVKAPGEVVVVRTAPLTFQASGVISDVLVRPGSVVKAGQTLVKLDSREAEAALAGAVADQKKAQARVDTVQNGPARELLSAQQNLKLAQAKLDRVKSSNAKPEELAAAQAAVDAAVYRYNAVVSKPTAKEVAAAEANLRQAKARLDKIKAGPAEAALREAQARVTSTTQNWEKVKTTTAEVVKQADIALQKAQKTRDAAKDTYDTIRKELYNPDGTPKKPLTPAEQEREKQAKLALDRAELDLQSKQSALESAKSGQVTAVKEAEAQMIEAQAALERLQTSATQQELMEAQAAVDKAQAEYDRAAAGPNQDEVNAAQAEINQARSNLDKLNKGGTDKDIQVAQAEVDKYQQQVTNLGKGPVASELAEAQGGLEKAAAQVKQSQLKVEQASLLAPFNSVVESVNVARGQTVSPGLLAVSLVDLSNLMVDAKVGEANIQRIKTGQAAQVFFEAISGVRAEPYKGKVTFISFRPQSGSISQPPAPTPALAVSPTPGGFPPTPSVSSGSAYPVSILLDSDPDIQNLKPGMSGRVRFVLERKPDVLQVPKIAVRTVESGTTVIDVVLPDGQVVTTPVLLGLSSDDYFEVIEDGLLREGDKIILYGDAAVMPLATATPAPTGSPSVGGTPSPSVSVSPAITGSPAVTGSLSPAVSPSQAATSPARTGDPAATPSSAPASSDTPTVIQVAPTRRPSGRTTPTATATNPAGASKP